VQSRVKAEVDQHKRIHKERQSCIPVRAIPGLKKSAYLAIMDFKEVAKSLPTESFDELKEIKKNLAD
jgi:hypothetical protein